MTTEKDEPFSDSSFSISLYILFHCFVQFIDLIPVDD